CARSGYGSSLWYFDVW
nr:immunoglobulin heavy chain junction region [Mus musculus]